MINKIKFSTPIVYTVDRYNLGDDTPKSTTVTFTVKNKKNTGLQTSAEYFYMDWYKDDQYTKPVNPYLNFSVSSYDKTTGTGSGTISTYRLSERDEELYGIHSSKPGIYYGELRNWQWTLQNLRDSLEVKELQHKEIYDLAGSPINLKYDDNVSFRVSKKDGSEFTEDFIDGYFKIVLGKAREDTLKINSPVFKATKASISDDKKEIIFTNSSFNASDAGMFTDSYVGEVYARLWVKMADDGSGTAKYEATGDVVVFNVVKEDEMFDSTKSSFTINEPKIIYVEPKPLKVK